MAKMTISIDLEAYRRLKNVRRGNESFSTVIKRMIRPPFDVRMYLKALDANPLSARAVAAIEKRVAARRSSSGGSR